MIALVMKVRTISVCLLAALAVSFGWPASSIAQTVAAGENHTLAVAPDGTVWAWGDNTYGQLGDGTTTSRSTPVQVSGLTNVVAVAAGYSHSLALKSDGTVVGWGRNNYGQVGDNTTTNRPTPTSVSAPSNVTKIAAGDYHSLAIVSGGSLYAWGQNSYGQLGQGNTSTSINYPVQVTVVSSIVSADGGTDFSVAAKSDGTAWAWGANGSGQLGDNTTTSRLSPIQVSSLTTAVSVAAGLSHSLAVLSDGTLKAWGDNTFGQLGDSSYTQRKTPVTVSSLSSVATVIAARYTSIALKTDGSLASWGYNQYGQFGASTPSYRNSYGAIAGISSVSYVALGGSHVVAATSTGVVYGWGHNASGQVGDGTATNRSTPTAISDTNCAWLVATPVFSVAPGTYTQSQNVSITSATPSVTIYYTTDGSTPTQAHAVVSGQITVSQNTTLKARAFRTGFATSNVGSSTYAFDPSQPSISPNGGTFASNQTVTLSTSTSGASIRYTTDGSTPTESSTLYSGGFSISGPTTLKAKTFKTGWNASSISSAGFSFSNYVPSTPTTTPTTGTYNEVQYLTLGCNEANAVIEYTTNGTDPTPGTGYVSPLVVSRTTTVKSRCGVVQPNSTWKWSGVTSATVTIKAGTPTVGLAAGEYDPGTVIQITPVHVDDVVRYRLDGQIPADTDPQIPVNGKLMVGNYTLKVRAFFHDMDPSETATATYTISDLYGESAVAAGRAHSMALHPDGTVWTWGSNSKGQLGYGERWRANEFTGQSEAQHVVSAENEPERQAITGAIAVGAGKDFSIALRKDGTVWTWGDNAEGTLGRTTCDVGYPSAYQCVRPSDVGLSGITAIAAGGRHAMALSDDGTVWTWGNNANGQLGDGTTISRNTPVRVEGLPQVIAVAAGYEHSLALGYDGRVWAWGDNWSGQIGDSTSGDTNDRHSPVLVESLDDIRLIAAGDYHSIAVGSSGDLWTWGNNQHGQLGNDSLASTSTPIAVDTDVRSATGGQSHTIAVKNDDTVWAWGDNANGQLGDDSFTERHVPTEVIDIAGAKAITAGREHSLAIADDGSVWSWGDNTDGQLGNGAVLDRSVPVEIFEPWAFADQSECKFTATMNATDDVTGTLSLKGPNDCDWYIETDPLQVTVDQSSGSGSGTLSYEVTADWAATSGTQSVTTLPQTFSASSKSYDACFPVVRCGVDSLLQCVVIRACFSPRPTQPTPPPPPANNVKILKVNKKDDELVIRVEGAAGDSELVVALWGSTIAPMFSESVSPGPQGGKTYTYTLSEKLKDIPVGQYNQIRVGWRTKTDQKAFTWAPCGDERDVMMREYLAYHYDWVPNCADFSTSGSSEHFMWAELSQSPGNGHLPFAIVYSGVWAGLEDLRSAYGYPVVVESGYRCPHGNHNIPRSAPLSRHLRGDAVDVIPVTSLRPWSRAEWDLLRDLAIDVVGWDYFERWEQDDSHLHVDYRYTPR